MQRNVTCLAAHSALQNLAVAELFQHLPHCLGCETATFWRIQSALRPAAHMQATLSEIWRWRRRGGGEWLAPPSVCSTAIWQPVCGNYMAEPLVVLQA